MVIERMIAMEQYDIGNNKDRKTEITELFGNIADNAVDDVRENFEPKFGGLAKVVGIRLGKIGDDWFDMDCLYKIFGKFFVLVTVRVYDEEERYELIDIKVKTRQEFV